MADEPVVWMNDALVPLDGAAVSPLDHGLTVGDGIFETIQIVRGEPFSVTRHLARLRRSAGGLGLEGLPDDAELRRAMAAVIGGNHLDAGRLRLTVTGGVSPLGSDRGEAGPSLIIATAGLPAWEAATSVVTVPWRRNEHSAVAGLKTTSYAENVVALTYAHDRGGSEAIFANTVGALCEGTGSNIFVVYQGRLCTPPLSSGCLAGITRELVCEVVEVDEVALAMDALAGAHEAFLTSSTRDVQSIRLVDGTALADSPGPRTREAAAAFAALMAGNLDP